jgi:ABC-type Mn2+/Zn2+ transport system permease subunit
MSVIERATAEAVLLGAAGGLVSVRILLRRLPFFTLAMTHATFPGVVLAAVAGVGLYAGGGLFGVLVVLGVLGLSRRREQDTTTATGIVLSAGFALGVVLLSAQNGFAKDLTAYTVGQILTVGDGDLLAAGGVGLLVVALSAIAGRLWTGRIAVMTAIAVAAGAGGGLIGVLVSDAYDVAAGGAITMVLGAMFALSLGITAALPFMRRVTSPRGR